VMLLEKGSHYLIC